MELNAYDERLKLSMRNKHHVKAADTAGSELSQQSERSVMLWIRHVCENRKTPAKTGEPSRSDPKWLLGAAGAVLMLAPWCYITASE